MIWLSVIILAVVQGIVEFLPISSSGHLLILKELLELDAPGVRLEVVLHLGTLIAVILYYRRRLATLVIGSLRFEKSSLYMVGLLALSVVPAGLIWLVSGRYLEPLIADRRTGAFVAALLLWITGLLLLSARHAKGDEKTFTLKRAWWIGVAQGFAVFPGISRSGSTITIGRHLGLSAEAAVEFSFLMSIPVLLASAVVDFFIKNHEEIIHSPLTNTHYLVGAAISCHWDIWRLEHWYACWDAAVTLFLPSIASAPVVSPLWLLFN